MRRGKGKGSEGRWGIYLILTSHLFRDVVKAGSMHPVKSAYGQKQRQLSGLPYKSTAL